jgi:hypothetical protein
LNTKLVAVGLIALTATSLLSVPLASSIESDMEQAINMLDKVFSSTMSTLDNGWSIAQRFKDPNYVYDPSEFKNPNILNSTITNSTITG